MDQTLIILSVAGALAVLLLMLGMYFVFGDSEQRRLRARLRKLTPEQRVENLPTTVLLQEQRLSAIPLLDDLLVRIAAARRLHLLLVQGDLKIRLDAFLLMILGLAAVGVAIPYTVLGPKPVCLVGVLAGAAPILFARRRRKKRIAHFERLFPDALGILTGALRAGMALSGAIQVVSEECADPVAGEFELLSKETQLGISMSQALRNLADRVDSKELHLFVIAVLLQRDTGGNLTEILEQTAEVIRERLRILGDVKAMTAQARLSGMILAALPIALGVFIIGSAPEYMRTLVEEPMGRYMLIAAAVLQVVGFVTMRKIAEIKV